MEGGQQTQLEGVIFPQWQRIWKLEAVIAESGEDTARPPLSWLPGFLRGPYG